MTRRKAKRIVAGWDTDLRAKQPQVPEDASFARAVRAKASEPNQVAALWKRRPRVPVRRARNWCDKHLGELLLWLVLVVVLGLLALAVMARWEPSDKCLALAKQSHAIEGRSNRAHTVFMGLPDNTPEDEFDAAYDKATTLSAKATEVRDEAEFECPVYFDLDHRVQP